MPAAPANPALAPSKRLDGDTGFVGVDERGRPDQLGDGRVAAGRNVRFRDGILQTRDGCLILPWAKDGGHVPFESPTHAMLFSHPSGQEWILVVAAGVPYRTAVDNAAVELPLELGADLTVPVRLHQCFDQIIAGRGPDRPPLVMPHLDTGFVTVTDRNSEAGNGTGTLPLPNFLHGESAFNRFLVVAPRDQVFISDIQNFTRHRLTNGQRINEGSADALQRVVAFNRDTAVCFKDGSVYKLTNWTINAAGDLPGLENDRITRAHGLAAPAGVVEYLGDLYYVTDQGVTHLRLTEQNEIQAVDLPLSDPMRRSWQRINWTHRDAIRMETWDNKLYVAAPLDEATVYGENLVPAGAAYTAGVYTLTGLTPGARYRLNTAAALAESFGVEYCTFDHLVNGTETVTGDAVFTAQGTSVTFHAPNVTITELVRCTVEPVLHEGVNTGVFVYDFLNRQWAGVDDADGILNVVDFLKPKIDGQRRLVFLAANGCLYLYEEGWHDERLEEVTPYVDLFVEALPAVGNTLQVNGGTLVSVVSGAAGASSWSIALLSDNSIGVETAADRLWQVNGALGAVYGYGGNVWTAPNTTPTQIADGVRFTSTNGVVPVLNLTGSWALTDVHFGQEPVSVEIESSADLRAYRHGTLDRKSVQRMAGLFSVWNARYSVTALANGVAETEALQTNREWDRTAYHTADAGTYDPANPNDDHAARNRQDYSVALPDLGLNLGSGVAFDRMQEVTEDLRCHSRGESTQFRIDCTRGRFALNQLLTTARDVDAAAGPKA